MKEKDIGEFFKEKLVDIRQEPSGNVWEKIQHDEAIRHFNKTALIKRYVIYSASFLTVAVAITGLIFLLFDFPDNKEPVSHDMVNAEKIIPADEQTSSSSADTKVVDTVNSDEDLQNSSSTDIMIQSKNIPSQITQEKNNPLSTTPVPTDPQKDKSKKMDMYPKPIATSETENSLHNKNVKIVPDSKPLQEENAELQAAFPDVTEPNPEEPVFEKNNNKLFIPKGFTPNGDGLNDLFLVYASFEIENFDMAIFDQNGRLVFKTKEITIGWDGEMHGEGMPTGSYAYIINYKDKSGKTHFEKGQVVLIR